MGRGADASKKYAISDAGSTGGGDDASEKAQPQPGTEKKQAAPPEPANERGHAAKLLRQLNGAEAKARSAQRALLQTLAGAWDLLGKSTERADTSLERLVGWLQKAQCVPRSAAPRRAAPLGLTPRRKQARARTLLFVVGIGAAACLFGGGARPR